MKVKHTLSLLALAACTALSTSAMAQSSITIIGEVGSDICDVNVNGSSTATVRLPKVTSTQLANPGQTAGDTGFAVALRNCDTSVVSQVQMNFSSSSASSITGRVASGVNNVSIQVLGGGTQVAATTVASDALVPGSYSGFVNAAGEANLNYVARYYREPGAGAVTGTLNAVVNLTVAYR